MKVEVLLEGLAEAAGAPVTYGLVQDRLLQQMMSPTNQVERDPW